jgi:DNA-binding LytR/AlgR family response regulator
MTKSIVKERRIVARSKRKLVFLDVSEAWAFEVSQRLSLVHSPYGVFDLDESLFGIATTFQAPLLRVHRSWLVNMSHVKELRSDHVTALLVGNRVGGLWVPVSRSHAHAVREGLLAGAVGIRRQGTVAA